MAPNSDVSDGLYGGRMSTEVNPKLFNLKGPGIFWIGSKIKKPDLLSWSTLLKWYDSDALPALSNIDGIESAVRLTAKDQSEEWPSLVLFVMQDLGLMRSGLIEQELDRSTGFLPGGSKYYDHADFDCRFYNVISSCESSQEKTMEKTKCLLIVSWDFRCEITDEEFDEWYYTSYNPMMMQCEGFLRSTRYKLDHGWWASGDGAELPCPDWLQICEFSTLEIDKEALLEQNATQSPKMLEIISNTIFTIEVYIPEKFFGNKTLFHGFGKAAQE